MSRSVDLWQGKTDDTQAPPRVRLRVFERCAGRCGQCGRKINAGESWTLEHLTALINGGSNAEDNLGVTCGWCLPIKNRADVKEKARTARIKMKHLGITGPKAKIQSPGFRRAASNTRDINADLETEEGHTNA